MVVELVALEMDYVLLVVVVVAEEEVDRFVDLN
jgi:hypothetical protein